MSADWSKGVEELVQAWQSDPQNARAAFLAYRDYLVGLENVSLEFKARPGVSYSLRARNAAQKRRELFVLVDVVDDEPESRWLSVCFYADMIQDPDELGDYVPASWAKMPAASIWMKMMMPCVPISLTASPKLPAARRRARSSPV